MQKEWRILNELRAVVRRAKWTISANQEAAEVQRDEERDEEIVMSTILWGVRSPQKPKNGIWSLYDKRTR